MKVITRSSRDRRSMIGEVARREIRSRARTKSFLVITGFLALAAIAGPLLVVFWPDGDDDAREVTVAVAAEVSASLSDVVVAAGGDDFEFEFVPTADLPSGDVDAALVDGDIDVAIEADDELAWNNDVDEELGPVLDAALQQFAAFDRGEQQGLTPDETVALLTPLDIERRFIDAPDTSDDNVRMTVALIGLMVSFMLPQVFGNLTLLGVVEEKSSGVVEVLLSHIAPRTLLLGKVLGLTVLALVQLAVVLAGLAASLFATNSVDIPTSVWQFVPILAVGVIGGLLLYNTLFALLGSLISRQEDASQVMLPLFVPLMSGFFVGQFTALGDADTLVARVFTFIPVTTPLLLPVRVARGVIGPWELALALFVLAASIWGLIRIAGRVYQFTLLHAGSRVGWKQAWEFARLRDLTAPD